MLTKDEHALLRGKLRVVEEAVEDVRACLDPRATISVMETKRRSTILRGSLCELKRYIEEDLS